MNDQQYLIYLRDCFAAGYTLPQFCIDNEIKKPLFVGINESQINFLWELHVQFQYDKRISAEFALLKGKCAGINFDATFYKFIADLNLKNISELNTDRYDKIFILTADGLPNQNIIYLEQLKNDFRARTYVEIPIAHFAEKNPDVKIIQISYPFLKADENNSEPEKKILEKQDYFIGSLREKIKKAAAKGETIQTPYDFLGYSNQEIYNLLEVPGQKINADKSVSLIDNEFLGIKNGRRMTAYQPESYRNKIFFVGNCVYYGYGVPYDKTVESCLQKLLNEENLPYRVENESIFLDRRGQDSFYVLNKLGCNPGDIIFFVPIIMSIEFPYLNVGNFFEKPHDFGEIFVDRGHINEVGHKILADYFFRVLVHNNFFHDREFKYPAPPPPPRRYGIPQENFSSAQNFLQNKELEEYKSKLREKRFQVGAIVMNCNPFTLGHEYLIEYAAKKVKKLYIFVVEEDKSEFKFADRFELVKRGVKKYSNVEVLPSGKFIISQQTFSGYFNKENLQDVAVDSSEDVEIFAREIAPSLGITVRFVGEEPEDSVTRQYNENMRRILPQYNIDFCEIPRREINGEVISAKKVRAALKVGDFDTIKKLVPKTTLKFLRENFSL